MAEDAHQEANARLEAGGPCIAGGSRFRRVRDWLLVGAGFGLYLGIVEVAVVWILSLSWPPQVSPHLVWMAPATNVALFLLVSLPLPAIARLADWSEGRHLRALVLVCTTLALIALARFLPGLHWAAVGLLAVGIGVQVSRLLVKSLGPLRKFLRSAIPAIVLLVGLCSLLVPGRAHLAERRRLAEIGEADGQRPSILLIVLDTVRAKSLGLYGRERPTTPNLERLARRATVFERAYATAPWTLPSHGSMFTGRYAHELSVDWWLSSARWAPLGDTYPTLAEVLSHNGYLTAGFVANLTYTTRVQGLDRGFVHYEDFPVSWGQALLSTSLGRSLVSNVFLRDLIGSHELVNRKSAERIRNDFLEWLDAHDRRPFFAFLNLFDAHEPYLPPRPYDRMFGAPSPRERMWRFAGLVGGSGALRIRKWTNSEAEDRQDLDLYEGAIAYVDAQLGALFAELERRGVLDGTLVVITSDHGEQHGEHGLHNHDSSLYLPLLHVPLLFVHPRAVPEGRRISQPVTLRDLPATIMDLVGFGDAHPFPGTSLRHAWTSSPEPGSSSVILSTLEPGDVMRSWYPIATGPMRSLIEGRYHYIRSGDAEEELYDLEADPRELRNLVGVPEAQPVLTRMRTRLDSALAAAHPRPPPRARRPGSDVAEASR